MRNFLLGIYVFILLGNPVIAQEASEPEEISMVTFNISDLPRLWDRLSHLFQKQPSLMELEVGMNESEVDAFLALYGDENSQLPSLACSQSRELHHKFLTSCSVPTKTFWVSSATAIFFKCDVAMWEDQQVLDAVHSCCRGLQLSCWDACQPPHCPSCRQNPSFQCTGRADSSEDYACFNESKISFTQEHLGIDYEFTPPLIKIKCSPSGSFKMRRWCTCRQSCDDCANE